MKLTNKVNKEVNYLLNNKYLKKLLSFEKVHQLVIVVLLVLYLLLDVEIPFYLANLVDTTVGNIVVVLLAVTLLLSSNVIIGLLGCVAAYELIQRSRSVTGNLQLKQIQNAEKIKVDMLNNYNDYPVSLEEEVVSKMAPLVHDYSNVNVSFKPVLNNLHDASSIVN